MPKTEPAQSDEPQRKAPGLRDNVRRHIGQTLRNIYADALTPPADNRIDALIERLDRTKN